MSCTSLLIVCFIDDCGDHVIVINSADIAISEEEWKKRVYFHHTGYPGGATWTLAWELHSKDPTLILKKAVYNSMDGNLQRRYTMERLHIFSGENVPVNLLKNVSNQIRQIRPVPKRLDHYMEEEIKKFPKLIDYPKDYILR
ncbi:39S ribosomal protein L13, mitochondrial [Asbolus verrucosus]|uniref:39S ribosomal protein L13, mitochondrial n=1 Tax=Asbolus verrucosus TaxID=1661398 RepID=A0A482VQC4_ASBVE|nr:39S ribosomal protein L13, mitochondrial [Asbolus verrucosus]